MLLGCLGTFLNSRPGDFAFLLLGRGLAGAAVGGLLPASFAMLADMWLAIGPKKTYYIMIIKSDYPYLSI